MRTTPLKKAFLKTNGKLLYGPFSFVTVPGKGRYQKSPISSNTVLNPTFDSQPLPTIPSSSKPMRNHHIYALCLIHQVGEWGRFWPAIRKWGSALRALNLSVKAFLAWAQGAANTTLFFDTLLSLKVGPISLLFSKKGISKKENNREIGPTGLRRGGYKEAPQS